MYELSFKVIDNLEPLTTIFEILSIPPNVPTILLYKPLASPKDFSLFFLVSCDNNHVHSFSKWNVTTQPTCVAQGVQSRECEDCGYVETSLINPIGHSLVTDKAVAATCTSNGKTSGSHCERCGEVVVAQNSVQATGHQYDTGVVIEEATCIKEGNIKHSCTICGNSYTDKYSIKSYSSTELYDLATKFVGEIGRRQ